MKNGKEGVVREIMMGSPVTLGPPHGHLIGLHGTALLLVFEEVKKYYRRKGHSLDFLG